MSHSQKLPSHPLGQLPHGRQGMNLSGHSWLPELSCGLGTTKQIMTLITTYFLLNCILIPLHIKSFHFYKKPMMELFHSLFHIWEYLSRERLNNLPHPIS